MESRLTTKVNSFLPYGETLKSVLAHPSLSNNDLKKLLRNKGIFVDGSGDEVTFPLLTTSLLTPVEFDFIIDKLQEKEDRQKISTRPIAWKADVTLINAVPEDLQLKELLDEGSPRYKLLRFTPFAPIDGDLNRICMDFACETTMYNKAWYRVNNQFTGKVILEYVPEERKTNKQMIYTSPETYEIADKLLKSLDRHFKAMGYVDSAIESERILYGNFTNEERCKFLLSLTDNFGIFTFRRTTDVQMGRDSREVTPDSLEVLKAGSPNRFSINGDALHESIFLRDNIYHKYIELAVMEAEYEFAHHVANGVCKVKYGFDGYFTMKTGNVEFSLDIDTLTLGKGYQHLPKTTVRTILMQEFEKFKMAKYREFEAAKAASAVSV